MANSDRMDDLRDWLKAQAVEEMAASRAALLAMLEVVVAEGLRGGVTAETLEHARRLVVRTKGGV